MKLVLAEKPSVAMSLSKVIGADQRGDGYMEGNGYLVSWCVGHLVELSQPEAYDEKYAKWRYDDLPILPEHWQYQVSASTKKQFDPLCRHGHSSYPRHGPWIKREWICHYRHHQLAALLMEHQ